MKVSVVIPVYNTRPYLADCLDSILSQDLPAVEFEMVAVDDGSTDGSGELLDQYARLHPNVRVIHQENSGWPGQPRNVGRAASRGTYVFFADSDDCLGPEALRRMYDFAVAHDSDIVVPKVVPLDGPRKPEYGWRKTRADAELDRVMNTIGPWKLFRQEFLDEHGLRFPEGKLRLEDGIFVTEAYLTARRVSMLADYDYYRKRRQPDKANISSAPVEPEDYISSVATMMQIIRRHCADEAQGDALIAGLYRRKALKWFRPGHFPDFPPDLRETWVEVIGKLQDAHVPPRIDDLLPLVERIRSVLVRHGETAALVSIGTAQRAGAPLQLLTAGAWFELPVSGLRARPSLVIAPGLRLVPAAAAAKKVATSPPPAGLLDDLVGVARRHLWPVARRTIWGRRLWGYVRKQVNRRRG